MMIAAPAFAAEGAKTGYFEASGDVMRVSGKFEAGGFSEKDSSTFLGAALGAGAYFAETDLGYHQLGAELGLVGDGDNDSGIKSTSRITTGLVVYNYNFKLPNNVGTIYAGVSGGMAHYNEDIDDSMIGKATYSDANFAAGIQAGAKIRLSDTVSLNAGYRFMKVGDMNDDVWGVDVKIKDITAHEFKVGVTFAF